MQQRLLKNGYYRLDTTVKKERTQEGNEESLKEPNCYKEIEFRYFLFDSAKKQEIESQTELRIP